MIMKNFLNCFEEKFGQYCERSSIQAILRCFSDSDMLMEQVDEKKNFDAFILDIAMPT